MNELPEGPPPNREPPTYTRPVLGMVLVSAAATLWALIGVCTRELEHLGIRGAEVGTWRALIGGACFVGNYLIVRLRGTQADRGDLVLPKTDSVAPFTNRRLLAILAAFCAVGIVLFYAALPLAVDTGGISLAWLLLYTAPVWVTIGSVLLLGERPGPVQWSAVVTAILGVVLLVSAIGGTVDVTVVSVSWGLLAGISYSSHYLLGRWLFVRLGAVETYAIVLPVGGIVLLAITGLTRPDSFSTVAWLVALGVGCTFLPYLLFALGLPHIASSRAVVVATVEPVVAVATGVVLYGERLGVIGVLGAAAVLAAAVVAGTRR